MGNGMIGWAVPMMAVAVLVSPSTSGRTMPTTTPPGRAVVSGELTVFAATSLTAAFTDLAQAFEQANPDVDVTLNFAGSSALVSQILEGAPVDVFASADEANMARLVDADGASGDPETFATNALEIIVAPGNPEGIDGLGDLADSDLIVVSAAPEVPIGAYTAAVLENAGVTVEFRSLEENVGGIVTKVVEGEADAGIVYVSDVIAAGDDAQGIEISADVNVTARYPLAVTSDARNPAAAAAFETFLLEPGAQDVLAGYGFGPPSGTVGTSDTTTSDTLSDTLLTDTASTGRG